MKVVIKFDLFDQEPALSHYLKSFQFQTGRKPTKQEIQQFFGNWADTLINDLDSREIDVAISEDFECVNDYLDMSDEDDDEDDEDNE